MQDGQYALQDWRETPSARALVLAFLSTSGARPMRTAALIRRAEVCGVDGAAIRVALGRLVREGVVTQVERGAYAIGPAGRARDVIARGWAQAEARVRPWDGRWIVVAVAHLGRARQGVRLRERALSLAGLLPAPNGLWVRPDNLALSLNALADTLHDLGLEKAATLIGNAALPAADAAAMRALWPRDAIEAGYRHWITALAESEARVATLPREDAARETLLLGQAVIRAINRDPMLPDAMIDAALRRDLIAAMRRYDAVGKALWARIG